MKDLDCQGRMSFKIVEQLCNINQGRAANDLSEKEVFWWCIRYNHKKYRSIKQQSLNTTADFIVRISLVIESMTDLQIQKKLNTLVSVRKKYYPRKLYEGPLTFQGFLSKHLASPLNYWSLHKSSVLSSGTHFSCQHNSTRF